MKPWISGLVGMFAILLVLMPRPVAASEQVIVQPLVMQAHYWRTDAYHPPWYSACRNPRFRRHHPFLCR
jgi:hypothetical protein